MKRFVGLVVVTEVDGLGRVAVLQRRGEFNHETMKPESYPGGCQVTAHGGVEEGEDFEQALLREAEEELGNGFVRAWQSSGQGMQEMVRLEENGRQVRTYGVKLSAEVLGQIRLGPSSGGLVLLPEAKAPEIKNLKDYKKDGGVHMREVIAMFPDARDAVRKALLILK